MTTSDGRVEILYCIASGHDFEYTYNWSNARGTVGINSPVLYAFEAGTYHCHVSNGMENVCSEPIMITEGTLL